MRKVTLVFLYIYILFLFSSSLSNAATVRANDILCDNMKINSISISPGETKKLEVSGGSDHDTKGYRWQVLVDTNSSAWADISNGSDKSIDISYPILYNVINKLSGKAYIRCITEANQKEVYSNTIEINILFNFSKKTYDTSRSVQEETSVSKERGDTYIIINYICERYGNKLSNSYIKKVEKGSKVCETIESPEIPGFKPYIIKNGREKDGEKVEISSKSISDDICIDVIYRPIEVDYEIKYYIQNEARDGYDESSKKFKARSLSVITGEEIGNKSDELEGFSLFRHSDSSIDSNGSTVIEAYYNRNYYLLRFDKENGEDPVYIYGPYGMAFD